MMLSAEILKKLFPDRYRKEDRPSFSITQQNCGLNNHRMSFLGLALLAQERDARVIMPFHLPNFIPNFDPSKKKKGSDGSIELHRIFDTRTIQRELERMQLAGAGAADLLSFGECFRHAGTVIRSEIGKEGVQRNDTARFLASLGPSTKLRTIARKLRNSLPRKTVGVQLRIETDWVNYIAKKGLSEGNHAGEEITFSAARVFQKIRNNPWFADYRTVYACCDEEDLSVSRDDIRAAGQSCGFKVVFKSDLLPDSPLTSAELSMVDFSLCEELPAYVGLTRSTFSNMLCLVDAYHNRVDKHFIFNSTGDEVRHRQDHGRATTPERAINPRQANAVR